MLTLALHMLTLVPICFAKVSKNIASDNFSTPNKLSYWPKNMLHSIFFLNWPASIFFANKKKP